jgi:hypothetical protein
MAVVFEAFDNPNHCSVDFQPDRSKRLACARPASNVDNSDPTW